MLLYKTLNTNKFKQTPLKLCVQTTIAEPTHRYYSRLEFFFDKSIGSELVVDISRCSYADDSVSIQSSK